jgi:diguanylate cyclase (GGDEF)-like protein
VVAILAGGAGLGLQRLGVLGGSSTLLLIAIGAYGATVGLLAVVSARRGRAGNVIVAATVLADLAFIFSSTIASSSVGHYDRILILSFFILHLTESYFGRSHAALALAAVVTCYVAMVESVIRAGGSLVWGDELLSVVLFTIAGGVFVLQYGSFQRRLGRIIDLFAGAEEGDFTNSYDVSADRAPDAITEVGRAYNRVRSQLASMVLSDPLTSCLNRRGLDQALAREVSRSTRAGSALSMVALDLDHFKAVNDTYGHPVGDQVLRELGALLLQTARGGDVVARTGGEEFTVLLPDTDPAGAYRAGVRFCEAVRAHAFMAGERRLTLTVSVGVTSVMETTGDIAAALKARADGALYAAKRGGRDRVRVWSADLSDDAGGVAAPTDFSMMRARQSVSTTK